MDLFPSDNLVGVQGGNKGLLELSLQLWYEGLVFHADAGEEGGRDASTVNDGVDVIWEDQFWQLIGAGGVS